MIQPLPATSELLAFKAFSVSDQSQCPWRYVRQKRDQQDLSRGKPDSKLDRVVLKLLTPGWVFPDYSLSRKYRPHCREEGVENVLSMASI